VNRFLTTKRHQNYKQTSLKIILSNRKKQNTKKHETKYQGIFKEFDVQYIFNISVTSRRST